MEECRENLQPALDHIKKWTETWKVQMSASKCVFTTFTLNPKETNGKLLPNLFLGSEELRYDPNPVFLGITLDDQLTFSQHVERARKTMAQRAGSVAILSGKSYGSHPDTLRIAYISYFRSCWEYGAFPSQTGGTTESLRSNHYWMPSKYKNGTPDSGGRSAITFPAG